MSSSEILTIARVSNSKIVQPRNYSLRKGISLACPLPDKINMLGLLETQTFCIFGGKQCLNRNVKKFGFNKIHQHLVSCVCANFDENCEEEMTKAVCDLANKKSPFSFLQARTTRVIAFPHSISSAKSKFLLVRFLR